MTWLNLVLAGAAVVAVAALALGLRRERARTRDELAAAQAAAEALRERLDGLEHRLEPTLPQGPSVGSAEFVITAVSSAPEPPAVLPGERIEGRLFADLVLRETVVKAAGVVHGVRRATSPESRYRMRYVYSREVRQSRKRRRAELRRLRREAGGRRREDAA